MASKSNTVVVIGGKQLKLSGYASEEYLQKVALYLDKKLNECNKLDSFRRQPPEQRNLFLQLNLADDFFKAKEEINSLTKDIEATEKQMLDLKHQLVEAKMKLETSEKNLDKAKKDLQESDKKVVRLETELKNLRK